MKTRYRPRAGIPTLLLLLALALAGCGGAADAPEQEVFRELNDGLDTDFSSGAAQPTAGAAFATAAPTSAALAGGAAPGEASVGGNGDDEGGTSAPGRQTTDTRKIIKNADLLVEVESVDLAVSRIGGIAAQLGGDVMATQADYTAGLRSATITIVVPVDQFEEALSRIGGAGEVLSRNASGQDVTEEYVDLQSQLANLEATQARIRGFLDQAKTVEEALKVNAQLTEIERQISQIKGRQNFIDQKSAFSTITIQLREKPLPATPTPSPTPTPEPTPVAGWSPSDTAGDAYATLTTVLQGLATVAIWIGVAVLPLALPIFLAVWFVQRRSRTRRPNPPAAHAPAPRTDEQSA